VGEPDELTSLEVYNTVWPHDAVTIDLSRCDVHRARRRGGRRLRETVADRADGRRRTF